MSHNKIKVKDSHFCNKLDRKQSNKKQRQISTEEIWEYLSQPEVSKRLTKILKP